MDSYLHACPDILKTVLYMYCHPRYCNTRTSTSTRVLEYAYTCTREPWYTCTRVLEYPVLIPVVIYYIVVRGTKDLAPPA